MTEAYYIQKAWLHICLILGLSGNIFVLHGTIAHNAIKLDVMSKWIVKNLALVDILNCILVLSPILIIQYEGNVWTFGDTLCKLSAAYRFTFLCANVFLINALSFNKLYRCFFPLRFLVPSKRKMYVVTIVMVLFSLIPVGWIGFGLARGFNVAKFQPRRSTCEQTFTSSVPTVIQTIDKILLVLCLAMSCLTLIISNTTLVGYAIMKSNTRVNKLNILIVLFVTASFLLSFVPLLIVLFLRIREKPRDFAWAAVFLSSWTNPFIYVAVNPRFREYTRNKLLFWMENQTVQEFRSSISMTTPPPLPGVASPIGVTLQTAVDSVL